MSPPTPATHHQLDRRWSGEVVELGEGRAVVGLTTTPEMRADDRGLVHGGFVFSLADHAAMLAVNHPHVVLASARVRFLKPVRVGERLTAVGRRLRREGGREVVDVAVRRGAEVVFAGELLCVCPRRHVLDPAVEAAAEGAGG